ncbi:MAG: MFS transporter [Pseudonocardia sp.]|nr:MFS transporter [Pseudonocardia sp.]
MPRRLTVAGLYAGAFIGPFGGGVTVAMLPELGASYGVSSADVAVSVTAYLLPFAALQVVSGTLGERWGRLRTVRIAYVAYTAASLLCALAPTLTLFLGARALQGVANAFTTPLLFAALASSVAPERLGRALGWFGSSQAAGQTFAPLIGGVAAEVDWRWAFAVSAVVSALLALVGIPGPHERPAQAPRLRAAWRSDVLRVGVVAAVGWGCVSGLSFLVALRLEDVFGLSSGQRGLVLTGLGVAGIATARLVGAGADRVGPQRSVLLGAAAGIVVLVGVGLAPTVGLVAAAWALGGIATQLVLVGVNLLVLRSSPVNRGGSMSLVQAIRFGGGSLAPVAFTPVYDATMAGAFLLAAALVAVVIPVALPRSAGPQGPSTTSSARA